MYDYGKPYRQQFLDQEAIDKRHSKQINWVLFLAGIYFGGHITWYLMRTI